MKSTYVIKVTSLGYLSLQMVKIAYYLKLIVYIKLLKLRHSLEDFTICYVQKKKRVQDAELILIYEAKL